jgi:hypothetical protein
MNDENKEPLPDHFKGKEALDHVIEARKSGIVAGAEIHGTEISGPLSAATDALRETAVFLALLFLVLPESPYLLTVSALSWLVWKGGRSAWLGWARLERLHRIVQEERWEIEHHRTQERQELKELYQARGLEGKLLEDVLDVLMADGDRLLRVMVEDELALTLENQEHPLKQGLGAVCGSFAASAVMILSIYLFGIVGALLGLALILGFSGWISAQFSNNNRIPAILWHLGIAGLAFGTLYFSL